MFGRKKETTAPPASEATQAPRLNGSSAAVGKGRPTPTRREQEAARRRPLVPSTPSDPKAAKEARREAQREARIRQNQAMQNGDERYLPAKDKGPQRRFIRDYADARRNFGDFFLGILLVLFLISIFVQPWQGLASYVMWAVIIIWGIDAWLMWRGAKKRLIEKFHDVEPGSAWYAINRVMMIRRLRLPKPQVRYGEFPR